MEDQGQFLNRFLSASAVLTAVLVGGYVILDQPFESARSPSESSTGLFESRLWEDPLKGIYAIESRQEQAALSNSNPASSGMLDVLVNRLEFINDVSMSLSLPPAVLNSTQPDTNQPQQSTIVLGVIMPSGRYSLTSEIRRRIRYAVVSALNQSHLPSNSENLPILALDQRNLMISGSSRTSFDRVMMSYEVFRRDEVFRLDGDAKIGDVVLLWIPSSELGSKPVEGFASILSWLWPTREDSILPMLIGPDDSTGLANLLIELSNDTPEQSGTDSLSEAPSPDSEEADEEFFRLANRVDGYLDYGLPSDKYAQMLDCNLSNQAELGYSYETVRDCLSSLSIRDSDSTWHETIADSYPLGSWIDLVSESDLSTPVGLQLLDLAKQSDWYLDDGLNDPAFASLLSCVEDTQDQTDTPQVLVSLWRQLASTCLERTNVEDSDDTWFETMATDLPNMNLVAALGDTSVSLPALQLIIAANDYLDNGIPVPRLPEIRDCLSGSDLTDEEGIANCLNPAGDISDSDPDWQETVAERFAEDFRPLQFDSLTAPQISDVSQREQAISTLKNRIRIFSPRATIANDSLIDIAESRSNVSRDHIQSQLQRIIRMTNTDDNLLFEIFDELSRRGIGPESRVALIYESDSSYGRALRAYLYCGGGKSTDRCFSNLTSYSYLRGIDGQLPGEAQTQNDGEERSGSNQSIGAPNFSQLASNLETPDGRQQLDYLRRVAHQINEEDYDAIGVLGTDIFDKLQVLQALGDLNPGAIFFTTDLYSYLAHDSQQDWSRNLLVTSTFPENGFGDLGNSCLSFLPDPDGNDYENFSDAGGHKAPPFRDNYQSAYFYSTCYALRTNLVNSPSRQEQLGKYFNSRSYLYEIGRNGPVALQKESGGFIDISTLRAARNQNIFLQMLLIVVLLSPLIIVLGLSHHELGKPVNAPGEESEYIYRRIHSVLLVVLLLLLLSAYVTAFYESGGLILRRAIMSITLISVPLILFGWRRIVELRATYPGEQSLGTFWIDKPNALLNCKLLCNTALIFIFGLLLTEFVLAGGEPLSMLDGVSSWPATLIRIEILVLCICFCFYAYARWAESNYQSERALLGASQESKRNVFLEQSLSKYLRRSRKKLRIAGLKLIHWNKSRVRKRISENKLWRITQWLNQIDNDTVDAEAQRKKGFDPASLKTKSVSDIWQEYRKLGNWRARIKRITLPTLGLTMLIFYVLIFMTPSPAVNRNSYWLADVLSSDLFILGTAFVAILVVILGNDVTRLGAAFIRALRQYDLSAESFDMSRLGLSSYGNENVDRKVFLLEVIAERTKALTPLVLFPFIIVFMMIFARSSLFEGWRWGFQLIIVYLGIAAYILYGAFLLQREATKSRNKVLGYLNSTTNKLAYWQAKPGDEKEQNLILQSAIEHVANLNEGAFVVWYKHPIFQSIAVPTSGTSGLLLLQSLM